MARIDAVWSRVRRKFQGGAGASQMAYWQDPYPVAPRVPYLRLRPNPCQSTSRRQCESRARWARIMRAWNEELTAWDRERWGDEAHYWGWWDEEHVARHLIGIEFFAALNARVLGAGLPLVTDAYDIDPGWQLDLLELELVTASRVRVTFEPEPWPEELVVLWFRGPQRLGEHAGVPVLLDRRSSVPSRWRLLGYGPLGDPGPVEFDLPVVVGAGRKLSVMGCLMHRSGMVYDDWLVEEVVGG